MSFSFLRRGLFLLWLLVGLSISVSTAWAGDPIKVDEAFQFLGVKTENGQPVARWRITKGYYLYRDRFQFTTDKGQVTPQLPKADIKDDPIFGKTPVYHEQVAIPLKVTGTSGPVTLTVRYQGCWEGGVCYPPQIRKISLTLAAQEDAPSPPAQSPAPLSSIASETTPTTPNQTSSSETNTLAALQKLITPPGASNKQHPLPVEEAFRFTAQPQKGALLLRWEIAPEYYLYRDRIRLKVLSGDLTLPRKLELPKADMKDDPIFGKTAVYHAQLTLPVSLHGRGKLQIEYQGCWEGGVCYPPVKRVIEVDLPAPSPEDERASSATSPTPSTDSQEKSDAQRPQTTSATAGAVSETDRITRMLEQSGFWLTVGLFLLMGLGLSLTPCVFPMIPILSSIIVGQGESLTPRRAFLLSLTYVLAMSVAYTVAGVLAGLFGANLQVAFQNPWVLGAFSLIFVLLALSMFGFYELQLPASLQTRLNNLANRQQGGTLMGVAVMGVLSALIVGPCVAPPLAGALIYIGQTGDALLGGMALFAMSMGMGLPLIIAGTLGGRYLPRAGQWMDTVKAVFGVVMLALALWILERILPTWLTVLLAALLAMVSAIYMGALDPIGERAGWRKLWKGLGLALLIWSILLLVGLARGTPDLLTPLKNIPSATASGTAASASSSAPLRYTYINSMEDLKAHLGKGQPVLLDFYADWCISCKEMERFTLSDPQVQALMRRFTLLKADVTENQPEHKALMRSLGIIGPPAILFFAKDGQELRPMRVIGTMSAEEFARHLRQVLDAS